MVDTRDDGDTRDGVHPVDDMRTTLTRLSSLLETLTGFYDAGRERFAVNESFVQHALLACDQFCTQARRSLGTLEDGYDLRPLSVSTQSDLLPMDLHAAEQAATADASQAVEDESFTSRFSFNGGDYQEPAEVAAEAPVADTRMPAAPPEQDSEYAQSYLELLRKLTAAEIFAVEQQALAPPGTQHQLLPLLRSLREDFQKLHTSAA